MRQGSVPPIKMSGIIKILCWRASTQNRCWRFRVSIVAYRLWLPNSEYLHSVSHLLSLLISIWIFLLSLILWLLLCVCCFLYWQLDHSVLVNQSRLDFPFFQIAHVYLLCCCEISLRSSTETSLPSIMRYSRGSTRGSKRIVCSAYLRQSHHRIISRRQS